jgi:ribonucleoside-diphosphate reductase alpha chain
VAFVGLLNGKPYEIFTGKTEEDRFPIPKWVEKGNILQVIAEDGTKSYDFQYFDKDGYEVIMRGLSRCFNPEFWNYAKMISALLRHDIPLESISNIVAGLNFSEASINSWRNGILRAIKKFIQDGTKPKEMKCPSCGQETLEIKEGCAVCTSCGFSKCGN